MSHHYSGPDASFPHGDARLDLIAAMASAWLRRNVRQVCDGGPRRRIMYLETVDSAISNPSLSSSPWMRGAPHNGFSLLIRWMVVTYHFRLAIGFATVRAQSMNRWATGLSVRCLRLIIATGRG
jgi:hypothetical protein